MTLDDFRKSLTATEAPAGLTHALAGLWWDAKGDWTRRTNPPNRMKARMARGFTRTSIARKEIRATRLTGIVGLIRPCAGSRSIWNGSAS
jgi:hypothetical protein